MLSKNKTTRLILTLVFCSLGGQSSFASAFESTSISTASSEDPIVSVCEGKDEGDSCSIEGESGTCRYGRKNTQLMCLTQGMD